eukprot:CAMPEP_0202965150 /NCGR_PEP_ID=MMETSP1396-20130829/9225_1 /ASSEMBLY_ACC=CAM_ASM_000872 /TAXON_ID= /ORGANISM="Pseudokeronopsis sp., Strain Brazil" /LENGTH=36 /DNA_ID= /DNA_START= /DNA_END= /DNA_ORIENTATION=
MIMIWKKQPHSMKEWNIKRNRKWLKKKKKKNWKYKE